MPTWGVPVGEGQKRTRTSAEPTAGRADAGVEAFSVMMGQA